MKLRLVDYLAITVIIFVITSIVYVLNPSNAEPMVEEKSSIDVVLSSIERVYDLDGDEGVKAFCQDGWDHKVIEFEGSFFRCRANWANLGDGAHNFRGYRVRIAQYSSMEEILPDRGVEADEERLEYLDCKLVTVRAPSRITSPCGTFTWETR